MKKYYPIGIFSAALVTFLIVTIYLFPVAHPFYSLKNLVTSDSILTKSKLILGELDLGDNYLPPRLEVRADKKLLKKIQKEYGIAESNELIINGYPAFYWRSRINERDSSEINFNEAKIVSNLLGDIRIDFDQYGNLLEMNISVSDETELPVISEANAKIIGANFIRKYTEYTGIRIDTLENTPLDSSQSLKINQSPEETNELAMSLIMQRNGRTDFQFVFNAYDELTNEKVNINVELTGNVVSKVKIEHVVKEEESSDTLVTTIISIVLSVLIFIAVAIIAYKKFRAYEIGFKVAFAIGLISALGLMIQIIVESGFNFELNTIIGMILGPLFLGGTLVIAWAVNEAVGREEWTEKYIEFDLLVNGHFFHSKIGNALLYGISFGLIASSLWLILIFISDQFFSISVLPLSSDDALFNTNNEAVYLLGKQLYRAVYKGAILVGFVTSFLKRFINNKILLLLAASIIWALALIGNTEPFAVNTIIEFFLGMIFIGAFIKLNLFTALISIFTFGVYSYGISFFFIENTDFQSVSITLIILGLIPVLLAVVAIITKDKLTDIESITPLFAKNVTERQRLQGEIQAAKSIQASFLPNTTPKVVGLDIAAKCLPALEVGGDYYDFIQHDDQNLSVLIGDVAGKGTKAAFVMSLTKGFFKALARKLAPPAKVLSDMNELFYQEVGRGSFISIIYGQFDLANKKFTYGRAGHNPILYLKNGSSKAEYLQPKGIAIGMEKGILFSKTIEEQVVNFESGDIFVLYTDGFPEAMNTKNIQFGEDDFANIVESCSHKSAKEIMEVFFKDTLKFIGKAKQYDDMTMVVVKVK